MATELNLLANVPPALEKSKDSSIDPALMQLTLVPRPTPEQTSKAPAIDKTKEPAGEKSSDKESNESEKDEGSSLSSKAFKSAFDKRVGASSYTTNKSTPQPHKVAKADDNDGGSSTSQPETDLSLGHDAFQKAWDKKISLDSEGKVVDKLNSNQSGEPGHLGMDSDSLNKAFDEQYGFGNNEQTSSGNNESLSSEAFENAFDQKLSDDNSELFGSENEFLEGLNYSNSAEDDFDFNMRLYDYDELEFEDSLSFDNWQPDYDEDYFEFQMNYLDEVQAEEQKAQELKEEEESKGAFSTLVGVSPESIKDEATRVEYESREKQSLAGRYGVGVVGKNRLATEYNNPVVEGFEPEKTDPDEKVTK
jgi:hypothetical protein